MILSIPVVENIASVFKYNYEKKGKDMISAAMSVLKIMDFEYRGGKLLYDEKEIEEYDNLKVSFRITPVTMTPFDEDCVRTVLNNMGEQSVVLSPIMDCIGWSIYKEASGYGLKFIGGSSYEVWREPGIPWDMDVDREQLNWKEGDDWADGIDFNRDRPSNWLE